MAVVIVTGTPGTGKTSLAKALAKKLHATYVDVNALIKDNRLAESYDAKRKTVVVDERKVVKALLAMIKKNKSLVIDSHFAHELPKKYVDLCIVTKCNISELKKRLEKRGYHAEKIQENIDAELFDICCNEAYEKRHNLLIVDTTKKKPSQL